MDISKVSPPEVLLNRNLLNPAPCESYSPTTSCTPLPPPPHTLLPPPAHPNQYLLTPSPPPPHSPTSCTPSPSPPAHPHYHFLTPSLPPPAYPHHYLHTLTTTSHTPSPSPPTHPHHHLLTPPAHLHHHLLILPPPAHPHCYTSTCIVWAGVCWSTEEHRLCGSDSCDR